MPLSTTKTRNIHDTLHMYGSSVIPHQKISGNNRSVFSLVYSSNFSAVLLLLCSLPEKMQLCHEDLVLRVPYVLIFIVNIAPIRR